MATTNRPGTSSAHTAGVRARGLELKALVGQLHWEVEVLKRKVGLDKTVQDRTVQYITLEKAVATVFGAKKADGNVVEDNIKYEVNEPMVVSFSTVVMR